MGYIRPGRCRTVERGCMRYKPNDALRPVLGTLAHNRIFTYTDFEEYCWWAHPRINVGPSTLQALVRHGYIERNGKQYNPTHAGWQWIEGADHV